MTKIVYETYYNTHIIECSGHTDYSCGDDILCSAVSILVATLKAYLEKGESNGEVSNLKCILQSGQSYITFDCNEDSPVLCGVDALVMGFEILSDAYPDYISFES